MGGYRRRPGEESMDMLGVAGGHRHRVFQAAAAVVVIAVIVAFAFAAPPSVTKRPIRHTFPRDQIVIGLPEPSHVRGLLERRTDHIDGFARRLAEEAAAVVGFRVRVVELPGSNGIAALRSGEVDALAALSISADNLTSIVYTSPLLVTRGAVFARPGAIRSATIETLREGRVTVASAGVAHQWCLEHDIPCIPAGSLVEALRSVVRAEADYAVTTQVSGRVDVARYGIRGLVEIPLDDEGLWRSFAMACRIEDASLMSDLDSGLAILRDSGRFNQLYDAWVGRFQPREEQPPINPVVLRWLGGLVGLVMFAAVVAYAVSQRRLAQRTAALRASEAMFRVLFDESPDGVMIVDPSTLAPIEANAAMATLLGISPKDVVGFTPDRWCAQWDDPRHQEDLARTVRTGSGDFDTAIRSSDGRVIDVRSRVRPILVGGRHLLQVIFRDITATKRAREAIDREHRLFLAGPVVCFRWRHEPGWPVEYVSENVTQFGYAPEDLTSGLILYSSLIHPDDVGRVSEEVASHLGSDRTHFVQEYRIRTRDGRWVWLADYTTIVRDALGAATRMEGYVIDITPQRAVADSIRESEERYRAIVENTPALIFSYFVPDGGLPQLRIVNSQVTRWREVFPWLRVGFDYRETIRPHIHPDDLAAYDAEVARARRDRDRFEIEYRLRSVTGEYRSLQILCIAIPSEGGLQWQCMLVDVTEMRRASEAARRSEQRYREIFDKCHDAIVVFRPAGEVILDANERALQLYGYSREEFVGKSFSMVSFSDNRSREAIERTLRDGVFSDSAWKQRCRDGSLIRIDVVSTLIEFDGEPAILSFNRDITRRYEVESALDESERRYRSFVQRSSEGVWCVEYPEGVPIALPIDEQIELFYRHGVVGDCNDAMARMYGLVSSEQLIGRRFEDMLPPTDPHNIEFLRSVILNGYRIEDAESHEVDVHGRPRFFMNSIACEIEEDKVVRAWGIQRDVTARRIAENELAEARRKLRVAVQSADLGTWTLDLGTGMVEADARYLSFFSIDRSIGAIHGDDLMARVHPDDVEDVRRAINDVSGGEGAFRSEFRVVSPDGSVRWISSRGALRRDDFGEPAFIAGASMDITEARLADEERERLSEQLRQAQKLESLGVMAGGIAHDFNNLLVAIMGNAALALKDLPEDSEVRRGVSRIEQAAARASELTRQLLTYAGRDQADPQPIDLSAAVREIVEIVGVSIDPGAFIALSLSDDLPTVRADPIQCRQIVMNLLSNASEALGGKAGTIRVSTGVHVLDEAALAGMHTGGGALPGSYVFIEVADTGVGIAPEVRARIFDPFYTTKFTGRGLGLTAVLGIVRRHAGAIDIDSEPGKGTTFRVYFPVSRPAPEMAIASDRPHAAPASGTILVVDDEDMVRDVARLCLEGAGFRVVAIPDGPQAVSLATDDPTRFDGVLLDMTMPDMSGPEVFAQIRRLRGDIPVLLTSGY
ncbi:MAG TPA: PAS domain S-box protein, partial [Phycisphaerales bacterium]|nr:PAS domain S-box protein [Phycisphaerales bacterium]